MSPLINLNVVGVVRNGGQGLADTLDCLRRLQARIGQSRVIIVTNDNTDDTDRQLARFSAAGDGAEIVRLDGLSERLDDRVDRICAARNAMLERLFEGGACHPLTLILDLDGPNAALEPEDVLRAAQRVSPEWDAVFANTLPAYYDLYALRCQGWIEEDVWQHIWALRRPLLFRRKWKQQTVRRLVHDRQYRIAPDLPLIAVDSAFGGLGLYRTEALRDLRYDARDSDGRLVCEHVVLHERMRARGARLFIDPGLRALAPSEHLGETSGAALPEALVNCT